MLFVRIEKKNENLMFFNRFLFALVILIFSLTNLFSNSGCITFRM